MWLLLGLSLLAGAAAGSHRELLAQCELPKHDAIAPTTTHAPVADLVWVGADDKYVFAVTKRSAGEAGGFWQSADGAKTWTEKTQLLNSAVADSKEVVSVLAVLAQKSNPKNVVVFGTGTYIWQSNDYGATFTAKQTPTKWRGANVRALRPHPRQENWLLLLVKRPFCMNSDQAAMECPHDLMLTQDLFGDMAWKNLTEASKGKIAGFVDFDWGASLCAKSKCPTCQQPPDLKCPKETILPDESIFAAMYEKDGDYDMPWDPDVHLVTTNSWFADFVIRMRCGNMFEMVGHSVYIAYANSCPTNVDGSKRTDSNTKGISLYTSIDGGQSFAQACLPMIMKQDGYGLVETHDGSGAVIVVNYITSMGFMDVQASSIYTAGPHHALFSLSMQNVADSDFGVSTDFAKVEGLPGIYIANQFNVRAEMNMDEMMDDYGAEGYGGPIIETRISFNGGGTWQKIPAPSVITNGRCNRCDGNMATCFLHLHGMTAWEFRDSRGALPAVYSNPSAPGFIMATGNVAPSGLGLDDNDGLCTWLSTDGGVTWRDVVEGAYIYEFADWGGAVVMAKFPGKRMEPAEEVLFSLDYGQCWHRVPLSVAMLVDNIRIEPDGQRPRVVVHGRACRKSSSDKCSYADDDTRSQVEGLMYMLDVSDIMLGKVGKCAYSDYEQFDIPKGPRDGTPRCVLGEMLAVTRRKPASVCLNGGDYVRPAPVRTACNCTMEDIECDYGFTRKGNECQPLPRDKLPQCPVLTSKTYTVSETGKRLIHGDICMNVQAVISDTDGAGQNTRGSGGGGGSGGKKHGAVFKFFISFLVILVICGLFAGWWVYLAKEAHRDLVRDGIVSAVGFLAGLYGMLRDKIKGQRRVSQEHDLGYFQPLGDAGGHDAEERGIFTLK